ncbi:hypothetical protein Musp01_29950 [Muricauda sp. NBRC 101325]|nr:hypothetical protein Musp01_29950 [Muricauda sp. NBRC 101325]
MIKFVSYESRLHIVVCNSVSYKYIGKVNPVNIRDGLRGSNPSAITNKYYKLEKTLSLLKRFFVWSIFSMELKGYLILPRSQI